MNLPSNNTVLHTRRIRPRLKPILGSPDLLPFINVFFLLLFFFMIGSSFVKVSGIPVNLPEVSSVSNSSVKKYIITLDKDNRIYFNDTVVVDLEQLKGKLLADIPHRSSDERRSRPGSVSMTANRGPAKKAALRWAAAASFVSVDRATKRS